VRTASDDERVARAVLARAAEPGDVRMTMLVHDVGARDVLAILTEQRDPQGLLTDLAGRIGSIDGAQELERAAKVGLRFVVPGDPEWPPRLDDLVTAPPLHERGGPPLGLWVKGPRRLDELAGSVAVVGARASTTYGESAAGEIAAVVSRRGVPVVSGGAFGIDVAAHRGALAADGPTAAVVACGADRVYPQAHAALLAHLGSEHAVVSEAAPGCAPQRVRFLARNRLIAAFSDVTVVVEAAVRSGALNTANWAHRLNRSVVGVPGPVTSASSAGVHQEIRAGAMGLVRGGADVLELLGAAGEHLVEHERAPERVRDRLTTRQQQVLDALPIGRGAPPDSVARVAGMGLLEVTGALLRLHEAGLVDHGDDGWRLSAVGAA